LLGYATKADLASATAALQSEIATLGEMPVVSTGGYSAAASPSLGGGAPNTIAAASNIGQLSGAILNNVTVNGVSGLTAGEIPDLSADYLPLNGGTLSGALAVTGTTTLASTITTTGNELITNGNFNSSAAGWTLGNSVVYGTDDLISTWTANHGGAASTTLEIHTFLPSPFRRPAVPCMFT